MSSITTITGKHFDPVFPQMDLIDVADISHSLSMICRANGHTKIFYSVAQHSIACAREALCRGWSKSVVIGCLMHDASEAYLSDVTRPVKKDLSYYLEVEERLQNVIWKKYVGHELTEEEKRRIFEIDDQMLSMEFHQLMLEEIDDSYKKLVSSVKCECRRPEIVKKEFCDLLMEILENAE